MPTKITVLATIAVSNSFAEAVREIREEYSEVIDPRLYYVHEVIEELVDENALREDLRTSEIVLLDVRGRGKPLNLALEVLSDQKNTVITLVGGTTEIMSLTRIGSFSPAKMFDRQKSSSKEYVDWKKIRSIQNMIEKMGTVLPFGSLKHAKNWIRAMNYWKYSGKRNIKNLLLFVAKEYGGQKVKPEPPVEFPDMGIYHPELDRFYTSLDDYLNENFDPGKPTVGVLFYGGMHFESSVIGAGALIKRLEHAVNVIPVFSDGVDNLKALRKFFFKNGKPIIDAAVSFVWFRINGGPLGGEPRQTLELLKELNIPIFDAAPLYMREIEKWRESLQGFSPVELVAAITLPELDGLIEPIPSLGLENLDYSDTLGADVKSAVAIDDRVERIAGRVLKWLDLRRKKNSEKKIAIVLYNYPPGEDNIGNAAYLDVFRSLDKILERLRAENYNVGDSEQAELSEFFLSQGLVNSGKWSPKKLTFQNAITVPADKYREWFKELSEGMRKEVVQEWGEPPGSVMSYNGSLLIPGIKLGNVFVGLQPTRGIHENPEKAYHDRNLPPHHQYIAFYKWLEKEFEANAVIHLGTHGTVEFMKGKEAGMSSECYPDFLIGNIPHLYVYHITNPSEAMIAKRRSYATLINHMSPPYMQSGLYEGFTELEELINEYHEAALQDPVRARRVQSQIIEKAKELNISSTSADEIYDELFAIKRSIIPRGLHIFGEKYQDDELTDFISFILRYDRGEIKSLNRILFESMGIDYDYAINHPNENYNGISYGQLLSEIEEKTKNIVRLSFNSVEAAVKFSEVKKTLVKELNKTLSFGLQVAANLEKSDEINSLIKALNGDYVFPNLGGDPIRTPEVLPTGSNTYQFDPRLVPSDAAYQRGVEIAEKTLKQYHDMNGGYPESVAVVLWGFETVKTRGETVGQILGYLGVKIVREKSIWFPKLKLIPLEELGRPRIDVIVNICGFFRDLFPETMKLLDEAFNMVASLEEESKNYVKKHSDELFRDLIKEFSDEKTAKRLSNARIFGPRSGEYGTRLTRLIETSNWDSEGQVAEAYIASMNNVYAENVHGKQVDEIYRKALSKVKLVSQVRDTHEYEVTDLDHYYEFFGGLSKAVETIKGEKPEMLITDTTKESIRTETVDKAIQRGVRTRLLNPKWIDAMLKHDYHGGKKIAERVEYMLGFAATTNKVDNWIWSKVAEDYLFNEEMRKKLQENNKWALHEMIGRLLEANQRGYWHATREELDKLRQLFLEVEGEIEE
nr:magnesium chelatase subunit H [Candidatus Freyarchaeota archaeon]